MKCGCEEDINNCDAEALHIVGKPWIRAIADGYSAKGFMCDRCNVKIPDTIQVDQHHCIHGDSEGESDLMLNTCPHCKETLCLNKIIVPELNTEEIVCDKCNTNITYKYAQIFQKCTYKVPDL